MSPIKLREVLIIDDDKTANYLNERIVREMEITDSIRVLHNGKDGLNYILEHCGDKGSTTCPELIILDHHMPVMDGKEMLETLHENGMIDKMRTVFLLLAIHTNQEDLKRFEDLGVQEFTDKPLSKERLQDAYQKYWADDTARDNKD